jgi:hypothetical protein
VIIMTSMFFMKRMRLYCLNLMLALCFTFALSLVAIRAIAQVPGSEATNHQMTLAQFLRMNDGSWNDDRDGIFVTVNPESVTAVPIENAGLSTINGLNSSETGTSLMTEAAQRFGRKVAVFGQVTVLAPPTMVVLNPAPAAPNIYAGLDPASKMRLLLNSLSMSQWHQIGSPGGLGAADLSDDLSQLFLSILPDPFRLDTATVQEDNTNQNAGDINLNSDERSQVRLRLSLATSIQPVPTQNALGVLLIGNPSMHRPGTSFLVLAPNFSNTHFSTHYGVALQAEGPNQLKKGQLDFDMPALTTRISLLPEVGSSIATQNKLTVGDLISRIGLATHLELYADERVANLPVWVRGKSAPACDLLRALCLSLTGTFRHVGPAYILTDDVEGIGTRLATLADWLRDADAQRDALMNTVRDMNISPDILFYLSLPTDDPLAQNATLANNIIQQEKVSYSGAGYETPLESLPSSERLAVATYLQSVIKQNQPVRSDVAFLDIKLRLTYVVPGVGDVTDEEFDLGSLANFVQTSTPDEGSTAVAKFQKLKARNSVLYISFNSSEEANRIVDTAKSLGISQLWIRSTVGESLAPLTAAIAEGKKVGLSIFAGVSLLSVPSNSLNPDVNIQGSTALTYKASRQVDQAGHRIPCPTPSPMNNQNGDWTPPIYSSFLAQKKELGLFECLPGLTGIVLEDTAAPGYERPEERDDFTPSSFLMLLLQGSSAATDMGYTEQNRLDFLRTNGIDPVDLVTPNSLEAIDLSPSLFPQSLEEQRRWVAFRYAEDSEDLSSLYVSIRQANPNLKLLLGERSGDEHWFGSWDKPFGLPVSDLNKPRSTSPQQAQAYSRWTYLRFPFTQEDTSQIILSQLDESSFFSSDAPPSWTGIVLDATRMPAEKAIDILKNTFTITHTLQGITGNH